MIGSQLGNYRVFERIGEGGMGTVYRAMDVMLERNVALKFLHPDLARQPELVGRFRSEAVVLARLMHPHIAAVYGLHKHEDDFYMAMEYVPGRTLADHLKDVGHLTPGHALRFALDVVDALEYAHEQGVVHRDIKSANIIVTPGGAIKVMDFGIARVLGGERRTMVGTIVGTLGYMSPEQIQGLDIDGRSDLYSLGIVLYEMLTGHVPFEAETEWALMQAQIQQQPTPPASLVEMPAALEAVILKALAKPAAERFQSAREFRAALWPIFNEVATADDRLAFARANRESPTVAVPVPGPPAPGTQPNATGFPPGDETVVRPAPVRPSTNPALETEATRLLGTPVPVPPQAARVPSVPQAPPAAVAHPAAPVARPAGPVAATVRMPVSRVLAGVGILVLVAAVAGSAWWVTQVGTSVPLPAVSAPSAATVSEAFAVPDAPHASAIDNVPVTPRTAANPEIVAADAPAPEDIAAVQAPANGAAGTGASATGPAATTTAAGTTTAGTTAAAGATAGERFERVKLLRRTSQGDTLEVDGILVVDPARIAVLNVNGTHPLLTFSVPNITSASYHESSQRRVFVRTRRYWLTLVTGGRNMEVRLTKEQALAVVTAVERVLGRPLSREVEPE